MSFKQRLWVIDHKLESLLPLILILLVVLIIRLPAFFEPVWYLDESIYLTIGHALNQHQVLYRDIVDHKTPIIYYLARVGGQTQFRFLLLVWMMITTTALYFVLKRLIPSKKVVWVTTLVFAIASASPGLEGLIPNGELFVLGFVMWGLWALSYSRIWKSALGNSKDLLILEPSVKVELIQSWVTSKSSLALVFVSGLFFGLAILTKVPALFDLMSVALLLYVGFWQLKRKSTFISHVLNFGQWVVPEIVSFSIGLSLPFFISVLYFAAHSALADYLQFGLLYNFHYAGSWVPVSQPVLAALLSLPAKGMICCIGIGILTLLRRRITPLMFWSAAWTLFALIGATLSNRPYPHYFMQLVLPLTFVCAAMLSSLQLWWHRVENKRRQRAHLTGNMSVMILLLLLVTVTWQILGTWKYSTFEYYKKFFDLMTHQMSALDYSHSFSSQTLDNYAATQVLRANMVNNLYIWGTNPSLYVLTKTFPADRLIVLFHVQDMKNEEKTIQNIITQQPQVIVVMSDAGTLPTSLRNYLHNNYVPWQKYQSFTLWRKRSEL